MKNLDGAINYLIVWQNRRTKKERAKKCLQAVRQALLGEGLKLPVGPVEGRSMWAIECFRALAEDPAKYGWKQVHHDADGKLPELTLAFYKKSGWLPWRLAYAGHIAILDSKQGILHANNDYDNTTYWRKRLIGCFLPVDG